MSPVSRAFALALLLALAAPLAGAQSVDPPQAPTTPTEVQCQPPVETCLPDLLPTNPVVEASDERYAASVCTDFINLGNGPTAQPFRILLHVDGIPVGEHQATGVYKPGEGGRNFCWGDIIVVAGRHTITVIVDSNEEVVEQNEGNNARSAVFHVRPTPRVDLRMTSFRVTPTMGGVGMNQLFILNISNIGDETAPPAFVTVEDDNGELMNWTTPSLPPGRSMPLVHATRPEYRPVGVFLARAVIDPLDSIGEIRETNNEAIAEYTVLEHPAPDYNITRVVVAGNRTEMRGVRVDVTVDNLGDRASRGVTVRIVNETNATIAQGWTAKELYPMQAHAFQFHLVLKAGNHSLRLIADPNNKVVERTENNNEWPLNIVITKPPFVLDLPNLLVERVYAMPEDPRPGEAVSVGALIHNIGSNKSNATSISFHVDGRQVGSAAIPSLKPDAFYSAYVPWIATAADTYSIVAIADPGDKIVELDEDDNALALDFAITSQRPPPDEGPIDPPDVEPEEPPVEPTPPTKPTPTTPTPPTNTSTASRVVLGDLVISTTPVPGGLKGVVSVSLRNPNIQPIGLLTVAFKVDGELITEKIVQGIRGAGTTAASTGEVDLPEGKHKLTAEVRIVGSASAALIRDKEYEAEAGPKEGVPGFELMALLVVLALASAWRRRA